MQIGYHYTTREIYNGVIAKPGPVAKSMYPKLTEKDGYV